MNTDSIKTDERVFSWGRFLQMPVVGIARNIAPDDLVHLMPYYEEAGLTTIEITLNSPGAEDMIALAAESYKGRLNVGAGTVCNREEAEIAVKAGAGFIVTPLMDVNIIRYCRQNNIPVFCGAYTPTEIYQAWQAGADVVKVFPCPDIAYLSQVQAPLSKVKLLPTGGVNRHNCTEYLRQKGVAGVGCGGGLFDKELIRTRKWAALGEYFAGFAAAVRAAGQS
jgi:2-dehydro-3-deoxyphosphogluconate aldolase/(4S)-4-hydroxy-2-oxoglutarate aldolase